MAEKIAHVFGADTAYSPVPWAKGTVTIEMTGVDYVNSVKILSTESYPGYNYPATPITEDGETFTPNVFALIGKITEGQTPSYTATTSISEVGSADGSYVIEQGFANCTTFTRNGYYYIIPTFSAWRRGGLTDPADLLYSSYDAFLADIDEGEIEPVYSNRVYFDVYINGTDKPSIFVNWTAAESMSPVLCSPKVWLGTQSLIMDNDIVEEDGIQVPNVNNWNVDSAGSQSYAGSYKTTYLSIMEEFENYLNPANKVVYWGFNGEPEFVRLYLRMDYNGAYGQLFRVAINKDGTLHENYEVPNSSGAAINYTTFVRIHYGEPDYILPEDDPDYPGGKDIDGDGPGRYDPDNPPPVEDFQNHEGNGFNGNAVLTKTYAVSAATLQNIGQKLWTQDYFNVLKVQNNPIENIVSVKGLPMEFSGTPENIKVGDISFGINGDKVDSTQKITIGTIKYTGKYGNYLDFAPYTKTKLNLPYIGLIELDPGDLYNSTLNIEYAIDLVTGQCMAILTLDGIPFMNVTGQMGFDIPLTASDRVQTELRVASSAVSAIGGAAGHMIGGDIMGAGIGGASSALSLMGADYTSQRTSSPSPVCASFANHLVYLLIDRPLWEGESEGYKHLHGYPCHKYLNLGSLSGFVAVDSRTDINIAMTSEENQMLEDLLTQGIYV